MKERIRAPFASHRTARISSSVFGVPFHAFGTFSRPLELGQVQPSSPAMYPTHGPGPDLKTIPLVGCVRETFCKQAHKQPGRITLAFSDTLLDSSA